MEPRWNRHWLSLTYNDRPHAIFLGGTPACDLWIDHQGDLRIVNGGGDMHWDYWVLYPDGELHRHSRGVSFSDEELNEAFMYLTLFVPDYMERMLTVQLTYNGKSGVQNDDQTNQ